jgi:uncharacterized cysteine cluster protein YcgN (CxxCxxCC family)
LSVSDNRGILEKPLSALTAEEWEMLCDRCGLCCLEKLEDHRYDIIHTTRVPCRLLDVETCLCRDYPRRKERVPDCLSVDPYNEQNRRILPETCAYRRRIENRPLPEWHPLVTGDPDSVIKSGFAVSAIAVKWRPGIKPENHIIEENPDNG